jgi:hypothetical protein
MSKRGFYSVIVGVALIGASAAIGISVLAARKNKTKKARVVDKQKALRRRWFHYLYGYYGKKY